MWAPSIARAARVACPKSPPEMLITCRESDGGICAARPGDDAAAPRSTISSPTWASRSVTVSESDSNTDVCRSAMAASKTRWNAVVRTATSTACVTSGANCAGTWADCDGLLLHALLDERADARVVQQPVARALNWAELPSTWPA